MEYIKKEFKKLGSMGMILLGAFLLMEHIYTYGGIDLWDILGHEWMGIVLIIAGVLTANRWGRLTFEEVKTEGKKKIDYILKR